MDTREPGEPFPLGDAGGWATADEYDSPAEVRAAFTTQRRIATGYFVVFLLVTFAVPTLALTLPWWTDSRLIGGMSPSFLMAAGGLYLSFLAIGLAAVTLTDGVEDRMLGSHGDDELEPDDGERT